LENGIVLPAKDVEILFPDKKPKSLDIAYFFETIDSTTLFCRDLIQHNTPKGTIEDGSGPKPYANKCACKWQIKAPLGKRILLEFSMIDTQPNVDFVWVFDGTATIPEYLIGKFSGTNTPPKVISRSHEVLVWFVSDEAHTGQGWTLNYSVVD
jgi:serine protease